MLNTTTDAYQLLSKLGATERLLTHVKLVGEAADMLIAQFEDMGLAFDVNLIRLVPPSMTPGKSCIPMNSMALVHCMNLRVKKCCRNKACKVSSPVAV